MSHKATYWAMSRAGLHPTEKLTLAALADCHNGQTGACFPSQERLAQVVNVSRSTINRTLFALEERGLITRITTRGANGKQQQTRYELHFRNGEMMPETVSHNDTRQGASRVAPMQSAVSHGCDSNQEDQSGNPPSPSVKTPPRGSRLPEDWQPNEDQIAYASQKGLAQDEITRIANDFADYWIAKAGRDAVKVDWNRTWQKWVRTELDRRGGQRNGRPASVGKPSGAEIAKNAAAIAKAKRLRYS